MFWNSNVMIVTVKVMNVSVKVMSVLFKGECLSLINVSVKIKAPCFS